MADKSSRFPESCNPRPIVRPGYPWMYRTVRYLDLGYPKVKGINKVYDSTTMYYSLD